MGRVALSLYLILLECLSGWFTTKVECSSLETSILKIRDIRVWGMTKAFRYKSSSSENSSSSQPDDYLCATSNGYRAEITLNGVERSAIIKYCGGPSRSGSVVLADDDGRLRRIYTQHGVRLEVPSETLVYLGVSKNSKVDVRDCLNYIAARIEGDGVSPEELVLVDEKSCDHCAISFGRITGRVLPLSADPIIMTAKFSSAAKYHRTSPNRIADTVNMVDMLNQASLIMQNNLLGKTARAKRGESSFAKRRWGHEVAKAFQDKTKDESDFAVNHSSEWVSEETEHTPSAPPSSRWAPYSKSKNHPIKADISQLTSKIPKMVPVEKSKRPETTNERSSHECTSPRIRLEINNSFNETDDRSTDGKNKMAISALLN